MKFMLIVGNMYQRILLDLIIQKSHVAIFSVDLWWPLHEVKGQVVIHCQKYIDLGIKMCRIVQGTQPLYLFCYLTFCLSVICK